MSENKPKTEETQEEIERRVEAEDVEDRNLWVVAGLDLDCLPQGGYESEFCCVCGSRGHAVYGRSLCRPGTSMRNCAYPRLLAVPFLGDDGSRLVLGAHDDDDPNHRLYGDPGLRPGPSCYDQINRARLGLDSEYAKLAVQKAIEAVIAARRLRNSTTIRSPIYGASAGTVRAWDRLIEKLTHLAQPDAALGRVGLPWFPSWGGDSWEAIIRQPTSRDVIVSVLYLRRHFVCADPKKGKLEGRYAYFLSLVPDYRLRTEFRCPFELPADHPLIDAVIGKGFEHQHEACDADICADIENLSHAISGMYASYFRSPST